MAADWTSMALDGGGRSLVEASAGTGKTWTISAIYLRLLLERPDLTPASIVVTTFSEPAAQELRERIRARLLDALTFCRSGRWPRPQGHGAPQEQENTEASRSRPTAAPTEAGATIVEDDAPDRAWLTARWTTEDAAATDALRLQLALASLDDAPIGTLHSLCARILRECPFECGAGFTPGELVAGSSLMDELVTDVWRRLAQPDAPLRFQDAYWWQKGQGELREYLRAALRPGVRLPSLDDPRSLESLLTPDLPTQLRDWLQTVRCRADAKLPGAMMALADALVASPEDPAAGLAALPWDVIELLGTGTRGVLKDCLPHAQTHPATAFATALHAHACDARIAALGEYRDYVRSELARRLEAADRLTFDALIERVADAVTRSQRLRDRLASNWPVALVDEFQDTDSVQFTVLDRIYRNEHGQPRGRLVMIGDPKQAIYGFRGGDIATYQHAAAQATDVLSLDTNYRSSAAYVAAMNELHTLAGPTLSSTTIPAQDAPQEPWERRQPRSTIQYEPVNASSRQATTPYAVAGEPVQRPLTIHLETDDPGTQPLRRQRALEACANHIAGLLDARTHTIGDRAVRPGDIAVLLPTHADIAELRLLLQQRRVPCVSTGRSSVFEGRWARELQLVLHAAWHPRQGGAIRAALATRLFGWTFQRLRSLAAEPDAWLAQASRFERLRQLWIERGVLAVVRAVLDEAMPALRALPDGERALTDLRHLGELLQAAQQDLDGAEELLAWLRRQRAGDGGDSEAADEQQLRIESDARRVTLLTLHAAKGLEFGIVFLPLMWAHQSSTQDRVAMVNLPQGGHMLSFDGEGKALFQQERQDERFRILYVALTRAIHACHLYALPWQRPAKKGGRSPLGDPQRAPLDVLLERIGTTNELVPLQARSAHIAWSEGWRWPAAELSESDDATDTPRHVQPMPPSGRMLHMHSFTTLVRRRRGLHDEAPAADEPDAPDLATATALAQHPHAPSVGAAVGCDRETPHPHLSALADISGAPFGNALHAIFEQRDPTRPMAAQHALIRQHLLAEGVWLRGHDLDTIAQAVAQRIQATLDHPIAPGLSLGRLPPSATRAEMAFHFVLDGASVRALRAACAEAGDPTLVPDIALDALNGLMTGKIDLVLQHKGRFHVLDYKSNLLGLRLSDYAEDALARAMDHSHYRFQALLYTVAVDRFLRQRLPAYDRTRHLGDAFYLFVRAVGLSPRAGIWRHHFDHALVEAVDAVLAGREAEALA